MQIMQTVRWKCVKGFAFFGKRDEKGGETLRSHAKCGHTAKA